MLLLAPVKMLSTGKKPSIYWKFCEGAMEFPSRKNRKTHKKLGHISCWYFRLFTLIKKSVFWWLVKWLTCVSNEWRAHFTNNLLEDDEHRILCELSGVSNVSLCGTRVVTLGVNPSQEGVACLTVDLNLSLHSPMLQRDRERISKFWLTVWISIISI